MARSRFKVIKESSSGRNLKFRDNVTKKIMTRTEFVREIEKGKYKNYHVRVINGIKTPVSNPDPTSNKYYLSKRPTGPRVKTNKRKKR